LEIVSSLREAVQRPYQSTMRCPIPEAVLLQRVIGTHSINFGEGDEVAFGICYQELTIERNVDVSE
jgi:hypothetical protein